MSSYQPTQPFRFLDLPGEIRNNIYDLLLCSWDNELERVPNSISTKLSKRSLRYPATSLLRANKQIHSEASDYMIKRNQFIRITFHGLSAQHLFLSDEIPAIATSVHKVSQYPGYVMHMTLSKPSFSASEFQTSGPYEMLLLRADLPHLCRHLDTESVMTTTNSRADTHASLHVEIKLNYAYTRFFTPKIQERLLHPIFTFLRGMPKLRILGPVDHVLATAVMNEVAKPRWTNPDSTLEEIGTGVDVGKRQWQQNSYYTASESWAYAMRTLERMRHSSSWLGLKEAGGEAFVNKTADLYFTLHLLHAQFLQVDMCVADHVSGSIAQRNGHIAIQHLRKCETASARFAQHAGATWAPSNQQLAKMLYRHAGCLRLMRDSVNRIKAVTLIEEAAMLAPNDLAIRDEKDAVLSWNAGVEETQRYMQRELIAEVVSQGNSSSLWSSVWMVVSALGA